MLFCSEREAAARGEAIHRAMLIWEDIHFDGNTSFLNPMPIPLIYD